MARALAPTRSGACETLSLCPQPASASTQCLGTPCTSSRSICARASAGLEAKTHLLRYARLLAPGRSSHHCLRWYSCHATGRLPPCAASETPTATWQLSCLPSMPLYWRVTPPECVPCLDRLHDLALQPRHQPRAVPAQPGMAFREPQPGAQVRHVPLEFRQPLLQFSLFA